MTTRSSRAHSGLLPSPSTWWKILGAAGVAGLVATGALTVRQERRRAAYTPDEIRERLHRRHAEAEEELARREVVLDSAAAPARTLPERVDLMLRRYENHLPPFVQRRVWGDGSARGRPGDPA